MLFQVLNCMTWMHCCFSFTHIPSSSFIFSLFYSILLNVRLSVFLSHIKSVRAFSSTNLNECEWVDVLNCVVFLWHFFTIQNFLLFILMQNYFKETIVCWFEFSYLFLHLYHNYEQEVSWQCCANNSWWKSIKT